MLEARWPQDALTRPDLSRLHALLGRSRWDLFQILHLPGEPAQSTPPLYRPLDVSWPGSDACYGSSGGSLDSAAGMGMTSSVISPGSTD